MTLWCVCRLAKRVLQPPWWMHRTTFGFSVWVVLMYACCVRALAHLCLALPCWLVLTQVSMSPHDMHTDSESEASDLEEATWRDDMSHMIEATTYAPSGHLVWLPSSSP